MRGLGRPDPRGRTHLLRRRSDLPLGGLLQQPRLAQRTKREIKIALDFVKTDWLHFDNLSLWPEPHSCHCKYCTRKFREFLQRRYPSEQSQVRRFGFPAGDFSTFSPPNYWLLTVPPWKIDRWENPIMQEWIEFRCWTVTDYIREMSEYGRSLKPDVVHGLQLPVDPRLQPGADRRSGQ